MKRTISPWTVGACVAAVAVVAVTGGTLALVDGQPEIIEVWLEWRARRDLQVPDAWGPMLVVAAASAVLTAVLLTVALALMFLVEILQWDDGHPCEVPPVPLTNSDTGSNVSDPVTAPR